MTILSYAFAALTAAVPIALLAWLARWLHGRRYRNVLALLALGGGIAGATALWVESAALSLTGLSYRASEGRTLGPFLVMFLFVAPLEEALKYLMVWPTVRTRRLDGRRRGVLFAVAVACGFAAVEGALGVAGDLTALSGLRAFAALPAHVFCAGAWGYALGRRAQGSRHYLVWVWLFSTVLHGLYDHIVFGRGPGVLGLSIPLMLTMGLLAWSVLREVGPGEQGPRSALGAAIPDPPSLRAMRRALRRTDQPLMLHWIAIGALVNVGVVLSSLAAAVWIGHRLGFDFASADETDLASNAPIVLIGTAVLVAFPVAGYLVARASGTRSVLEPAMGTAVAIVLVVAALSVTAPVALLFASALAPIAFGLACAGAWFGTGR